MKKARKRRILRACVMTVRRMKERADLKRLRREKHAKENGARAKMTVSQRLAGSPRHNGADSNPEGGS